MATNSQQVWTQYCIQIFNDHKNVVNFHNCPHCGLEFFFRVDFSSYEAQKFHVTNFYPNLPPYETRVYGEHFGSYGTAANAARLGYKKINQQMEISYGSRKPSGLKAIQSKQQPTIKETNKKGFVQIENQFGQIGEGIQHQHNRETKASYSWVQKLDVETRSASDAPFPMNVNRINVETF